LGAEGSRSGCFTIVVDNITSNEIKLGEATGEGGGLKRARQGKETMLLDNASLAVRASLPFSAYL